MKPYIAERYTLVIEECAEVIQSITKIQRHGEESYHPIINENNIDSLFKELVDLKIVVTMLEQHLKSYEPNGEKLLKLQENKLKNLHKYVHCEENKKYIENELDLHGAQ